MTDNRNNSTAYAEKTNKTKKMPMRVAVIAAVLAVVVVLLLLGVGRGVNSDPSALPQEDPGSAGSGEVLQPEPVYTVGYLASDMPGVELYDASGVKAAELPRGTRIEYTEETDGRVQFEHDGMICYVSGKNVSDDPARTALEKVLYIRTTVNMTDESGTALGKLLEKGSAIAVLGYDYLESDGSVHRYYAMQNGEDGYVLSKYVTADPQDAAEVYNGNGLYELHAGRGDLYGGGDAEGLDYYPRVKPQFEDNVMPEEARCLYLSCSSWVLGNVEEYIEIADACGINAFVVDIVDGGMVGYASPVMEQYSPTACLYANNTMEEYGAAIQRLKDAGYYVIGRITTFNDPYFVVDHPECAIRGLDGEPLKINTMYWPSAYNRYAWEYKVSLAVEAVEEFGFCEIQFDYVRFPDLTYKYDRAGTIDYINTCGETKVQAIQRFLMYACDRVHEAGAYVGVDVFGECAFGYVTAYGQYWPALSGVVDVICGMPYPDHFSETAGRKPWLYPYDTLYNWGLSASARQEETASPAVVRTWIQAYDAIKAPYNAYGADEVGAEIRGLRDSGASGGYMTWNFNCSTDKYRSLSPAFDL